jgi:hypothetical protein
MAAPRDWAACIYMKPTRTRIKFLLSINARLVPQAYEDTHRILVIDQRATGAPGTDDPNTGTIRGGEFLRESNPRIRGPARERAPEMTTADADHHTSFGMTSGQGELAISTMMDFRSAALCLAMSFA